MTRDRAPVTPAGVIVCPRQLVGFISWFHYRLPLTVAHTVMCGLPARREIGYAPRMQQAAARKLAPADPTFYPVDDDMGESLLHRDIVELIRTLLQRFIDQKSRVGKIGANQFIYWVQFHAEITIAPDVYLLPGVPSNETFDIWKTWETGVVPSFALEVVSKTIKKDYETILKRYEELGVREVVIFDPLAGRPRSRRVRWQVYRRIKNRGFVRVEVSNEDRVHAKEPGCWLRMEGHGKTMRLRVATGPRGDTIFPSAEEEAEARADAEAAKVKTEAARAEAEATRAEAEATRAEAEAARAEAEAAKARAEGARAEAEAARADAEAAKVKAIEAELDRLRGELARRSSRRGSQR